MSAYLTSNEDLSTLATYWLAKANDARTFGDTKSSLTYAIYHSFRILKRSTTWGVAAGKTAEILKTARPGPVIFQLLLEENLASLKYRYPDSDTFWDHSGYRFREDAAVQRWMNNRTTGQVVPLVRSYEYQSCEHPEWEASIAYQLCQQIRHFLLLDLQERDANLTQASNASLGS